jgi:hypothetical protein
LLYFYIIIKGYRIFQPSFMKLWDSAVYFTSILCPSIFRQIAAILNGSPLLCPINATSSFSYVFRLHYPRVLHYRIVPIEKLATFVPLGRKNPPVYYLGSK